MRFQNYASAEDIFLCTPESLVWVSVVLAVWLSHEMMINT